MLLDLLFYPFDFSLSFLSLPYIGQLHGLRPGQTARLFHRPFSSQPAILSSTPSFMRGRGHRTPPWPSFLFGIILSDLAAAHIGQSTDFTSDKETNPGAILLYQKAEGLL